MQRQANRKYFFRKGLVAMQPSKSFNTNFVVGSEKRSFLVAKGSFGMGDPESDRKAASQHVKKLADAIFMTTMNTGDVSVRAIGKDANYNAVKAIQRAIERCSSQNVHLFFTMKKTHGDISKKGVQGNHVSDVTGYEYVLVGYSEDEVKKQLTQGAVSHAVSVETEA